MIDNYIFSINIYIVSSDEYKDEMVAKNWVQ